MKKLKFKNGYKLIKTDKIDTVLFQFFFPIECNFRKNIYIEILNNILCTTNEDFKEKDDYEKEALKMCLLTSDLHRVKFGNTVLIKYTFEIPKENLIKDYNIFDSFKFAIDSLIKPDVKDSKFNQYNFDIEKKYLISKYEQRDKNINSSNSKTLFDIIDYEEKLGLSKKHAIDALNSLNNEEMYEYYLKNIKNNKPFIYVYGDIEESTVNELFNKFYPLDGSDIEFVKDYICNIKDVKEDKYEIKTNFNQTELDLVYQTEVTEDNYYLLGLVSEFLSSRENDLVFKTLRTKYNLVYEANVSAYPRFGFMYIRALIQDKNIEKAKKLIDEIFDDLTNKEKVTKYLNNVNKYIEYDLLKKQDSLFYEIDNMIDDDLELLYLEKVIEKYKNITVDEVISFVNNFRKTSEIIFRGKNYED